MKKCFLTGILFFIVCCTLFLGRVYAQAGHDVSPLSLIPLLSGSFGELRATHFHTGIDLKTGGRVGLPVRCVSDGLVSRISVSATGYGNALYIDHPDGTTTVYGHLQRYNKKIEEIVRRLQYEKESFAVDENVCGCRLFFKKGDTVAFSGNSGSSGGPHLHFEYRDTRTEKVINPLTRITVKDNIAPRIQTLYLYSISSQGKVRLIKKNLLKAPAGNLYTAGNIVVPAGTTGVGIFVTDAMNDSGSKLGIYKMGLSASGKELFRMVVDSCDFALAKVVNDLKDYDLYRNANETVYCCFGNFVELLPGVIAVDKGYIRIGEGEHIPVKMFAEDRNGNRSELSFTLQGGAFPEVDKSPGLLWDKSYVFDVPPYYLELPAGSLLFSVDSVVRTETYRDMNGNNYSVFVAAVPEVPLKTEVCLRISGPYNTTSVICRLTDKKKWEALPTFMDNSGLYCNVSILGKFAVLSDTISPVIEYAGVIGVRPTFRIRDNLSGIASYRGEVNGKWCLFEYDAKTGTLSCSKNEPAFVKNRTNKLKMLVKDRAGNTTERNVTVDIL